MFGLVDKVLIEDESLRGGLQNEQRTVSIAEKFRFIHGMADCGVRQVQRDFAAEIRPAVEAASAPGRPTVIDVATVNDPTPTGGLWNTVDNTHQTSRSRTW